MKLLVPDEALLSESGMGGQLCHKTAYLQGETRTLTIQDNNSVCVCMCVHMCVCMVLCVISYTLHQTILCITIRHQLVTYFEINQSVIQLFVLINVMSYTIVDLLTGWT